MCTQMNLLGLSWESERGRKKSLENGAGMAEKEGTGAGRSAEFLKAGDCRRGEGM